MCIRDRHYPAEDGFYRALAEELTLREPRLTQREMRTVRGAFRRVGRAAAAAHAALEEPDDDDEQPVEPPPGADEPQADEYDERAEASPRR